MPASTFFSPHDTQRRGSAAAPRDLTALVMPRGLAVLALLLALVAVLGVVAARDDTRTEIAAALALANAERTLHELSPDDATARRQLQGIGELRHVALTVRDGQGQALFDSSPQAVPALLRWATHLTGGDRAPSAPSETWSLPRPGGAAWTVSLAPSPASEQAEAWQNLFGLFALMLAWSLLSLALLRWNIRRAFRPLERMLHAIRRLGDGDASEAAALPAMPIAELDGTARALKQLAQSLRQAEEARQRLACQVQTLQEDERQRLARDLHDDFGQRLTALRADLAWLRRRNAGGNCEQEAVLGEMDGQLAQVQLDLRGMLSHLQPLGPQGPADTVPATRLAELLTQAAAARHRAGDAILGTRAVVRRGGGDDVGVLELPRNLVLALFRMTQEAFTNTARHAHARNAEVSVDIDDAGASAITVCWSARDDGAGLADADSAWHRGNGLAGMRERVWALDGEFDCVPVNDAPWRGLCLHARFALARVAEAA